MIRHHQNNRLSGFTLIEVAVALAILGWVLGSALFMVKQYADEKLLMRERFSERLVEWNQLLEQYQYSQGWQINNTRNRNSGQQMQNGLPVFWSMQMEEASGDNLYRFQVNTSTLETEEPRSGMAIYLVNSGVGSR